MVRVLSCLVLPALSILFVACDKKEQGRPAPSPAPVSSPPAAGAKQFSGQGELRGITASIQELKRAGNTVTLKFAMSNQSQDSFAFGYNFGEGPASVKDFGSIAGVYLLDSANKSHAVLRDSDHNCLCSRSVANIPAGSETVVWAKFDVPPDVQKVSVVVPHFPPIEDVPIT